MAVTLFAPILTNVTAPQAAAFPQLLLDIILPEVYTVSGLGWAGRATIRPCKDQPAWAAAA